MIGTCNIVHCFLIQLNGRCPLHLFHLTIALVDDFTILLSQENRLLLTYVTLNKPLK